MQRRNVLKNVAAAVGGLVAFPSWAKSWSPESIAHSAKIGITQEALLAEIVETIIPETATPGAKSLKVHQFALRMINDCYGEAAQKNLTYGLTAADEMATKTHNKIFIDCDAAQRLDTLKKMAESPDADSKQFVSTIKNLTIQGYQNAEYVMVNIQKYNMAPGFYHGCVPLKK